MSDLTIFTYIMYQCKEMKNHNFPDLLKTPVDLHITILRLTYTNWYCTTPLLAIAVYFASAIQNRSRSTVELFDCSP